MRATSAGKPYTQFALLGAATLLAALALAPAPVRAGDVQNLEPQIPVDLQDALPTDYGEREVQAFARYERTRERTSQGDFAVRGQWGFAPDWQASIAVPLRAGSDRTGSGNVQLGVFKKLTDDAGNLPSLAVSAEADLPTGHDARGLDATFTFIATHALGSGDDAPRVHGNVVWVRNAAPAPDERRNGYQLIGGVSRKVSDQALVVSDFVHERKVEQGQRSNVLEVGYVREVGRQTTVGIGAGAGFGEQSPRLRLTLALQQGL